MKDIAPEVIAAITAAINEVFDQNVRIKRIRYHARGHSSAWQMYGRTLHLNLRLFVNNRRIMR